MKKRILIDIDEAPKPLNEYTHSEIVKMPTANGKFEKVRIFYDKPASTDKATNTPTK